MENSREREDKALESRRRGRGLRRKGRRIRNISDNGD